MPIKTLGEEQPAMNLTSMIDVMFLLVIFFMVGSRFSDPERNMAIKVPQVAEAGPMTPAPEKRVINVSRDGRITLDRRELSLGELKETLAAARREYRQLGVVVRGDGQGAFQHVADVLSTCRAAGIADLGITVRMAHNDDARRR
jgi:biopolymer transport protein ExbD